MTNPDRDELVKLADELIAQNYGNVCDADAMEEHFVLLAKAATALRRLASSDGGVLKAATDVCHVWRNNAANTNFRMVKALIEPVAALERALASQETQFNEVGPSDPSSTRSDVTVDRAAINEVADNIVIDVIKRRSNGELLTAVADRVSSAISALLDQFEIRRK